MDFLNLLRYLTLSYWLRPEMKPFWSFLAFCFILFGTISTIILGFAINPWGKLWLKLGDEKTFERQKIQLIVIIIISVLVLLVGATSWVFWSRIPYPVPPDPPQVVTELDYSVKAFCYEEDSRVRIILENEEEISGDVVKVGSIYMINVKEGHVIMQYIKQDFQEDRLFDKTEWRWKGNDPLDVNEGYLVKTHYYYTYY